MILAGIKFVTLIDCFLLNIPLSAAGRLLFSLNQKVSKKFKYAVMHTNERWYQGGLKFAFVPNAQTANRPIKRQRSYALQRRWLNFVDMTSHYSRSHAGAWEWE